MNISRTFVIAIAVGALASAGRAQDLPDHKLSEWRLGNTISGEKPDLSKMEGKVVAIEYWGTR